MPTYSYACRDCEHRFDIQQAFTDDALTVCPECGGGLRKVFSAVGVVFKGSGFYRTDSRSSSTGSGSSSATSSKEPAAASSGGSSSDSGSSTSGASKGSSTPSPSGGTSSSTASPKTAAGS